MRLTQRLVLNTLVVATVLVATVLFAVERRVTEHVRAQATSATLVSSEEFLDHIRRDIVIAGVAVLILSIVFAGVLARPVARPIEELRDVARALVAGAGVIVSLAA